MAVCPACTPPWLAAWKPTARGGYQGYFQSINVFGKLETKIGFVCYIFLKYAVYGRCSEEHYIGAEVVFSFAAEFAVSAGFARFQSYAVTRFQVFHVFSYFYYGAARFVSQYEGRFYNVVAYASGFIIMHVRATDSYVFQFY